ncbi:MAG: inositol monophosphatase [Saprospiraceae bacterium]|nr:inositol monophosphatase [Saprospiraceae bacterium]
MSVHPLFELRESLTDLCAQVSVFIRKEITKVEIGDVQEKDMNSLVSYVDQEAERILVEGLQRMVPEAGFITEEQTVHTEQKDKMWIVDPLDGTTNYLQRIPHFSTSIALQDKGEIVVGIVYETMRDNAFTAVRGFGAWENNVPITVTKTSNNNQAIVVSGFPYDRKTDIDKNMSLLKHCILNYRGFRRLGSAALDLAYVASGRIDIYFEETLNIWDLAAGVLLVKEAGGQVSDYDGGETFLESGSIVSSNGQLHEGILDAIEKSL